jgi:hypothetical protein
MHYFKIKAGGPVGVFFSEKVHITNLIKKRKPRVIRGFSLILSGNIIFV